MKKRIIIALAVFAAAALIVLPVLAADLHFLLLRNLPGLVWNPIEGWLLVVADQRVRQFYFLLLAATALGLVWILVSGNYLKYQSDMQQITPDIQTPCAAGQGQFGSARWMRPEQFDRFFTRWKIQTNAPDLDALIRAGLQDKEEVRHAKDIHIR